MRHPHTRESLARHHLDRVIERARLALGWEAVWPRVVLLLTVVALFVTVSWLGLWRVVPDGLRYLLLAAFAVAATAALARLVRTPWPGRNAARSRVEATTGLDHRPIATFDDSLSPVSNDDNARALWQAHRQRLLSAVLQARAGKPRPDLARRDSHALRFVVPVLLVVAFAFAEGEHGLRLTEAFEGPSRSGPPRVPARIDAWVDPPPYTGQPPILLARAGERRPAENDLLVAPQGSLLSVRVAGASASSIIVSGSGEPVDVAPAKDGSGSSDLVTYVYRLETSGTVAIEADGARTSYSIDIIPDTPPQITRHAIAPNAAKALAFDYVMKDDYGVTGAQALVRPLDVPSETARPLVEAPEVRLTVPRGSAETSEGRTVKDLTSHPFAGSQVEIILEASDAAGQSGRTPALETTLPSRPFVNPLARALVYERRLLALDANIRYRTADALEALTLAPERFPVDAGIYLGLRNLQREVLGARDDDDLRKSLDHMWTLARLIEDGTLAESEDRLRAAQDALQEALENGASDEEIARLTEELREAMQDYLAALAEQMAQQQQNFAEQPISPDQMIDQRDLDRMLDQMRELAELGDREAAQRLLEQMRQMMENLQAAQRGMPSGPQSESMQQLQELSRLMREQEQLMEDTFQMRQGRRPNPRGPQGQRLPRQDQGEQGELTDAEREELLRQLEEAQSQLQQQLEELLSQMENGQGQEGQGQEGPPRDQAGRPSGSEGNRALGRAGQAMGEAAEALGQGEMPGALGRQAEALEAMRQGMENAIQQMQQQMGQGQGQGQPRLSRGFGPRSGRDPLGRPQRTEGPDYGDDVSVPDEIDVERARRILNAIRERLGERYRPRFELDYLERLIEQR